MTGPITITTFGYLHGQAPAAHVTLDLRTHFKDPHISPELRHMTAHDQQVQDAVLSTDGIPALLVAVVVAVRAYLAGPSAGPVHVAVGCAGGRHRAGVFGSELALRLADHDVTLTHRDLDKPVVVRLKEPVCLARPSTSSSRTPPPS